jgi:hypothetical protein
MNKVYIFVEVNIMTWRRTEIFIYSSVWRRYRIEHVKIVMLIDLNQKLLSLLERVFYTLTSTNRMMTENFNVSCNWHTF